MNKLIILGLDGATWKVLNPLIKEGHLPTFEKIVEEGTSAYLESTFPPITAPAWLSMATGKNPGKTGVTNFVNFDVRSLTTNMTTSEDYRKHGAIWDQLNDEGYTTYLIGYPMMYPYYNLQGVIVGGFQTPENAKLAYPESIEKRINNISNGYINFIPWHSDEYENNKTKLIKDLSKMFEKQIIVVEDLLEDEWDFFTYVCSVTDFLQHAFWADWKNSDSTFHQEFIKLWKMIDENLSIFMDKQDTNLFVVSDHGFGSVKNKASLMKWFIDEKYMERKNFYNIRKKVYSFLRLLNDKISNLSIYEKLKLDQEKIFSLLKSDSKGEILNISLPVPPLVDVQNSKTIYYVSGYHGSIHISINDSEKKSQLEKEIKEKMKELGKKLNFEIEIYEGNNKYKGPKKEELPDILFKIDDYECHLDNKIVKGDIYEKDSDLGIRSGSHRENGIFISHGPDIKDTNEMKNFQIYDVAPTILHHYNLPISRNIDGRVLKEIYREKSEPYQREIEYLKKGEQEKIKNTIEDLKI